MVFIFIFILFFDFVCVRVSGGFCFVLFYFVRSMTEEYLTKWKPVKVI